MRPLRATSGRSACCSGSRSPASIPSGASPCPRLPRRSRRERSRSGTARADLPPAIADAVSSALAIEPSPPALGGAARGRAPSGSHLDRAAIGRSRCDRGRPRPRPRPHRAAPARTTARPGRSRGRHGRAFGLAAAVLDAGARAPPGARGGRSDASLAASRPRDRAVRAGVPARERGAGGRRDLRRRSRPPGSHSAGATHAPGCCSSPARCSPPSARSRCCHSPSSPHAGEHAAPAGVRRCARRGRDRGPPGQPAAPDGVDRPEPRNRRLDPRHRRRSRARRVRRRERRPLRRRPGPRPLGRAPRRTRVGAGSRGIAVLGAVPDRPRPRPRPGTSGPLDRARHVRAVRAPSQHSRSRAAATLSREAATPAMSVLRTIESKIEGLFEGVFGRAFRTHVQPVELARKLAKEMDEHRSVSVSRVYVPNEYTVYLSSADRQQFASYEGSLVGELQEYLTEHARREAYALLTPPARSVRDRRRPRRRRVRDRDACRPARGRSAVAPRSGGADTGARRLDRRRPGLSPVPVPVPAPPPEARSVGDDDLPVAGAGGRSSGEPAAAGARTRTGDADAGGSRPSDHVAKRRDRPFARVRPSSRRRQRVTAACRGRAGGRRPTWSSISVRRTAPS